ncbi:MAG: ATP-dependent DNA helicase RecG [Candidatus Nomurabacteria bacterium]|nr:MAG: ATP-dependent DNA helicase RecG [Candidatus Nomurabacteria bacterium]
MHLNTPLEAVKGVGPKIAEQLAVAGLETVGDLISFLPRKYEDFSVVVPITEIKPGNQTIRARCEKVETKRVRRGMTVTTASLADKTGKLQAVWFNQPYRANQLKSEDEFYFSGMFEFSYNRYQLTSPSAEKVSEIPVSSDRIVPIYRAIKGLKSQLVRKILIELRSYITTISDPMPEDIVKDQKLLPYANALLALHFPNNGDDVTRGRERLAFDELFQLLLAAQLNKQANNQLAGWKLPFNKSAVQSFVEQLPFELTDAQRRAAWDIIQDFERETPMNRLLQGDVGSGKTVVAGLAARQAAVAGFQSAVMAPTEILASQHAETLAGMLQPHGVSVALLTGSVKGKVRQELYKHIADGSVDVVVGTHALIQEAVKFHKLGFVVIDEQHRFGVAQRQELLKKSHQMPHLLAMTATPIPRSLALTVYGELDISILNERPKGRKPIITKIWSPNSRPGLYELIEEQLANGRQAYVICSLIDDNPTLEQKSVQEEYKKLRVGPFNHRRIGLLHGKLKPAEKDAVMGDFAAGKIDILVSTTVVEVGVDVPNATVMLIENADRFGLAQLHQLRGRVGRSDMQSYCFLMMSDSSAPTRRLKEIEKSGDGFYLAEVDLKLRGPGEIYGRAQHGELNLQVATLGDTALIARAQRAARQFVESGRDLLQYEQLEKQVEKYRRLTKLN